MTSNKTTYWTSDRIMHLVLGVAITVLLILLVRYISDVLLPFFIACFVAYLLQPIVDINCRLLHLKGRAFASVLTLIDIAMIIALVVYLFLPSVVKELDMLGGIMHDISSGKKAMPPLYRSVADFISKYFDPDNLKSFLSGEHLTTIISGGTSILQESWSILMSVLSVLLTLIYILFILIDYPQICRGFKLIVPHKYRSNFLVVADDASQSMDHYFRGQGFVALCACIFYCTGFSIVGLPLAIPMGLLVGVLYMIPYFQYVTLVPVAAICFIYSLGGNADFLSMLGKCGLVYVVSQCVCDYVITPHVMGREMGMNPAVILLSLSIWGSLLGIIGMIIALPVSSLIMTYYTKYISEPAQKSGAQPQEDVTAAVPNDSQDGV